MNALLLHIGSLLRIADGTFIGRYRDYILTHTDRSVVFVSILYIITLYCIFTLIVLLIIILLNRRRLDRVRETTRYLREEYQQKLMDFLFEEGNRERARKELGSIASSPFNRQLLINEMIDLSINLKGEIREDIKELYLSLGLKKESLTKLHSRKWHENVKGIRELAHMDIRESTGKILSFVNKGNEVVRMEAQIALVRLSEDNPYEFLHHLRKPLAVWEQVTLHELLVQHNLPIPDFSQWFGSDNDSVVLFALEMTAWFQQKESGEKVRWMFSHPNDAVRHMAYRISGDLLLEESRDAMKEKFQDETKQNKLEILQAFTRMSDAAYFPFLKSVLDTEEDVQLQIRATKAIEDAGEPGVSLLVKLMKSGSEYRNYQIIIRHVLDGRIN